MFNRGNTMYGKKNYRKIYYQKIQCHLLIFLVYFFKDISINLLNFIIHFNFFNTLHYVIELFVKLFFFVKFDFFFFFLNI